MRVLFFCCDATCGASDTFVMYLDSFMVQQRPLYCASPLSASYCNHILTTTLAQLGLGKGGSNLSCDATQDEMRLMEVIDLLFRTNAQPLCFSLN